MNLYIIRNQEGLFFRAKGYGGAGKTWVDDMDKARIYTKIGQARTQVSWFYNNHPDFGVADILEFSINENAGTVLNEKERVEKQRIQKARLKEKRAINHKLWEKTRLENQIKEARERLNKL